MTNTEDKLVKIYHVILSLLYKYDFGAPVWRIRLDTTQGRLALEVRDADLLLTRFYTFDTQKHTLTQLELPQAQAWWQGLEDAQDGYLYLHGYGDRKLGQHKGIIAIAAAFGEVVWERPELAFYGITEGGVLSFPVSAAEHSLQLLAPGTGKALQVGISQQQAAEKVSHYSSIRYSNCIYPVLYLEGETYFEQVRDFVTAQQPGTPVKAIEYAETEGCLVISYYTDAGDGTLDNFLLVFDLEGNLQLKEQMGSRLSGIGSDTFFIFRHDLYFLLNKDILKVYRLLA
ncbi:MAG: DUF4905 domain-containing protein [Hymenobacteraceae bacterium]|nr:DUF4905 domain-containing protein [Hymenobacteraceae bacterium]MDX5483145.1 DUF4905 domain-containing protein [Hymenobacteraceae bacterium]